MIESFRLCKTSTVAVLEGINAYTRCKRSTANQLSWALRQQIPCMFLEEPYETESYITSFKSTNPLLPLTQTTFESVSNVPEIMKLSTG